MFGEKTPNRVIKGEFAKKIIEEVQRMIKLKKEGKDLHFENKERERKYNIIIVDLEMEMKYNMTEEKKQEILQKLQEKGLCSVDANLILDEAVEFILNKVDSDIEHYALYLADLLQSNFFIDRKTGEVKFKLSIDYKTGALVASEV